MKLKVRFLLSSPFIAISAYVFLIYIPYLYPTFHFPFEKVYGFWTHTLACFIIVLLILIARMFSNYPSLKIKKFETPPMIIPIISKKWYYIAGFFLLLSLLMNVLVISNGFFSYDGNIHSSKKSVEDFGGINILTQMNLFFFVPYTIYITQNKKKSGWILLTLLVFAVLLRSFLLAERLALLEFLLPLLIVVLTIKRVKVPIKKLVKYFLILLSFFMILELTRQFKNQYGERDLDVGFKISWTLERFFDYYGDTQNKFYFAVDHNLAYTTVGYLNWGERVLSRLGIDFSGNHKKIDYGDFVWRDFTNPGGLGNIYTDFGLIIGGVLFITFYLIFFTLWFKLKKGNLYAWSVYPFFFIWIIEFARYSPLYLTRFIVPFLVFTLIYVFTKYVRFR